MTEPIISVRNLTKTYRLYAKPADRLKEALWPWKARHHLFHALQDINFDVYRGENLGIIGVNGAGKSTLLQIITGVLAPSAGSVTVSGRIAALLELGIGFNPELTGRENTIFQMQLAAVDPHNIHDKVTEVEAFADVGDFFDQPMKLYSSGMYARVAFAASVFIEPDILVVDEILSVGDLKFQAKCARKFKQFLKSGATILFVSHNVMTINALCTKTLYLKQGKIAMIGAPAEVSNVFYKDQFADGETQISDDDYSDTATSVVRIEQDPLYDLSQINRCLSTPPKIGTGQARIVNVGFFDIMGRPVKLINAGEKYCLRISVFAVEDTNYWHVSLAVHDSKGIVLFGTSTKLFDYKLPELKAAHLVDVYFDLIFHFIDQPIILSVALGNSASVAFDSLQDYLVLDCEKRKHIYNGAIVDGDVMIKLSNIVTVS